MNESRASRYQRLRRRGQAAGTLLGALTLSAIALTPAAGWLAARSRDFGHGLPAAPREALAVVAFVILLVAVWELASLPAILYLARRVDRPYGPGAAPAIDEVLIAQAQASLFVLPAAVAVGLVWRASVAVAGPLWWIAAGLSLAALLAMALHGAPAMLAALAGTRPLTDTALAGRLSALADRAGVTVRGILEWQVGEQSGASALIAGAGRGRRVFISSEILRDWSADEIAVVVAHELAHHRYRDLWRRFGVDAAILTIGAGLADLACRWIGPTFGGGGRADLAMLPLTALIAGACWLTATPLRHAQSRRHERRADVMALALTGGAEAFSTAVRRLGDRNLVEDRPSTLTRWLFHRHPTIADRLALAEAYKRVKSA